MTPRSAQPLSPSPDLRRNPASHGAVGAMLWSALSSPLSSAAASGWPYSPVMPPLSRPGSFDVARDHRRSCTLGLCGIPGAALGGTGACAGRLCPQDVIEAVRGRGPENSQVGLPRRARGVRG
jgi:hypothetical protein